MELKKITYSGIDTDDVTKQMEEGNDKLAEKGWREYPRGHAQLLHRPGDVCPRRGGRGGPRCPRRGAVSTLCPSKRCDPVGGAPPTPEKGMTMAIGLIVGVVYLRRRPVFPAQEQGR